jgi:hypothetical protein
MKYYDHVIVGMGISALGVLEALCKNESLDVLVVDYNDNEDDYYYFDFLKRKFGKSGNGGNSDLWHGVVSKLKYQSNEYYDKYFDYFLKLYYPEISSSELNTKSFIPHRPMRPKKIISTKFKDKCNFYNSKLLKFEYSEGGTILYFSNAKLKTGKLWMCAGVQGTLKVLNESKCLSRRKYYIDEHFVGYFGQIKTLGRTYLDTVTYCDSGHLKEFITIKESHGLSMYLNVRPAHFGFKNINYAAKFRGFFGRKSSSIVVGLLYKLNPGLILEAMYNKFGLTLPASLFNVVGHVEIIKSLVYDVPSGTFSYSQNRLNISTFDAKNLFNAFGNRFILSNPVDLSPGLHLMNINDSFMIDYIDDDLLSAGISGKGIYICSGISLKTRSPEHPSFSLLVYSYMKAMSVIRRESTA